MGVHVSVAHGAGAGGAADGGRSSSSFIADVTTPCRHLSLPSFTVRESAGRGEDGDAASPPVTALSSAASYQPRLDAVASPERQHEAATPLRSPHALCCGRTFTTEAASLLPPPPPLPSAASAQHLTPLVTTGRTSSPPLLRFSASDAATAATGAGRRRISSAGGSGSTAARRPAPLWKHALYDAQQHLPGALGALPPPPLPPPPPLTPTPPSSPHSRSASLLPLSHRSASHDDVALAANVPAHHGRPHAMSVNAAPPLTRRSPQRRRIVEPLLGRGGGTATPGRAVDEDEPAPLISAATATATAAAAAAAAASPSHVSDSMRGGVCSGPSSLARFEHHQSPASSVLPMPLCSATAATGATAAAAAVVVAVVPPSTLPRPLAALPLPPSSSASTLVFASPVHPRRGHQPQQPPPPPALSPASASALARLASPALTTEDSEEVSDYAGDGLFSWTGAPCTPIGAGGAGGALSHDSNSAGILSASGRLSALLRSPLMSCGGGGGSGAFLCMVSPGSPSTTGTAARAGSTSLLLHGDALPPSSHETSGVAGAAPVPSLGRPQVPLPPIPGPAAATAASTATSTTAAAAAAAAATLSLISPTASVSAMATNARASLAGAGVRSPFTFRSPFTSILTPSPVAQHQQHQQQQQQQQLNAVVPPTSPTMPPQFLPPPQTSDRSPPCTSTTSLPSTSSSFYSAGSPPTLALGNNNSSSSAAAAAGDGPLPATSLLFNSGGGGGGGGGGVTAGVMALSPFSSFDSSLASASVFAGESPATTAAPGRSRPPHHITSSVLPTASASASASASFGSVGSATATTAAVQRMRRSPLSVLNGGGSGSGSGSGVVTYRQHHVPLNGASTTAASSGGTPAAAAAAVVVMVRAEEEEERAGVMGDVAALASVSPPHDSAAHHTSGSERDGQDVSSTTSSRSSSSSSGRDGDASVAHAGPRRRCASPATQSTPAPSAPLGERDAVGTASRLETAGGIDVTVATATAGAEMQERPAPDEEQHDDDDARGDTAVPLAMTVAPRDAAPDTQEVRVLANSSSPSSPLHRSRSYFCRESSNTAATAAAAAAATAAAAAATGCPPASPSTRSSSSSSSTTSVAHRRMDSAEEAAAGLRGVEHGFSVCSILTSTLQRSSALASSVCSASHGGTLSASFAADTTFVHSGSGGGFAGPAWPGRLCLSSFSSLSHVCSTAGATADTHRRSAPAAGPPPPPPPTTMTTAAAAQSTSSTAVSSSLYVAVPGWGARSSGSGSAGLLTGSGAAALAERLSISSTSFTSTWSPSYRKTSATVGDCSSSSTCGATAPTTARTSAVSVAGPPGVCSSRSSSSSLGGRRRASPTRGSARSRRMSSVTIIGVVDDVAVPTPRACDGAAASTSAAAAAAAAAKSLASPARGADGRDTPLSSIVITPLTDTLLASPSRIPNSGSGSGGGGGSGGDGDNDSDSYARRHSTRLHKDGDSDITTPDVAAAAAAAVLRLHRHRPVRASSLPAASPSTALSEPSSTSPSLESAAVAATGSACTPTEVASQQRRRERGEECRDAAASPMSPTPRAPPSPPPPLTTTAATMEHTTPSPQRVSSLCHSSRRPQRTPSSLARAVAVALQHPSLTHDHVGSGSGSASYPSMYMHNASPTIPSLLISSTRPCAATELHPGEPVKSVRQVITDVATPPAAPAAAAAPASPSIAPTADMMEAAAPAEPLQHRRHQCSESPSVMCPPSPPRELHAQCSHDASPPPPLAGEAPATPVPAATTRRRYHHSGSSPPPTPLSTRESSGSPFRKET